MRNASERNRVTKLCAGDMTHVMQRSSTKQWLKEMDKKED